MKNVLMQFLLLLLLPMCSFAQISNSKLEKTTSFFPEKKTINEDNIEWNYLIVPENWDKPEGKTIKIAVAVLKSTSKKANSNPVLYIEGGPGAGGINSIGRWLKHPLRESSDIVLMDVRGTGFSFPKFCPDLGKQFLEILAKNQNSTADEQQKSIAAMACKQDLMNRNIEISTYNSKSIAKDLNALKAALKLSNWNVYAVSYGTYTAQVYANDFPLDIKSLILDSSISDIANYYNGNTANYVHSLNKVFEDCKNDPNCNKKFPSLEMVYYETIDKLGQNPVTVSVSKKIISTGVFTYNAEDFKIAIQQGLYSQKLIEVIPMLIYEFNKGNKAALSSLVAAFSGALSLDYGQYYAISCNEVIPFNSRYTFDKNAKKFEKLNGGLSFYKSDFLVYDKWNSGNNKSNHTVNDLSNLSKLNSPVLVFSGSFDPITPASNGRTTLSRFKNSYLITAPVFGHAPGFSKEGYDIVKQFVNNPNKRPNTFTMESDHKVNFVTDVKIDKGVSGLADSLSHFDFLFFAPFLIAIIILLISIFNFSYTLVRSRKFKTQNKALKGLILVTSILGLVLVIGLLLAIINTAQNNFYILAFGIAAKFNYLFLIQWIFVFFTVISIFYFIVKLKTVFKASLMATILFSLMLTIVYFQYWGFLF